MKRLVFVLLMVPAFAYAQTKGSTKIIAKLDTTGVFDKITLDLFDKGATFETKDKSLGLLSTGPISSKKYSTSSKIRIRFSDSSITITGYIVSDVELFGVKSGDIEVSFSGAKKSPMRDSWNLMDELAKKYSVSVIYSK